MTDDQGAGGKRLLLVPFHASTRYHLHQIRSCMFPYRRSKGDWPSNRYYLQSCRCIAEMNTHSKYLLVDMRHQGCDVDARQQHFIKKAEKPLDDPVA